MSGRRVGSLSIGATAQRALAALLSAIVLSGTVASAAVAAERTISLYSIHTRENLTVTFKRNGRFIPEALKKINWLLRDWRRDAVIDMDPKLIDLAWEIHTELGSREPIHVISGYRSPATNAMLRRTRGGQARRSQHMLGHALDMHFPDVPIHRLRYSALIRERGGVGYYPTSALPFVHIDTARVRHWPRMPRPELALLFPTGRTLHRPSGGGALTREDVANARRNHPGLAERVAAFKSARLPMRNRPTLVAAATPPALSPFRTVVEPEIRPPAPRLAIRPPELRAPPRRAAQPQLAAAPQPAPTGPSPWQVASLGGAPGATWPNPSPPAVTGPRPQPRIELAPTWARAPDFDEEHPEELSYRPFPIVPLLTDTAFGNHPILDRLMHPDSVKTLAMLGDMGDAPPLRMRPGRQQLQAIWSQAFSGRAIELETLIEARRYQQATDRLANGSGITNRRIVTAPAR